MVKRALLFLVLASLNLPALGAEPQSIPQGTLIHCRLAQTLSTRLNFQGETFVATVSEPLMVSGKDVIPVGTKLEGRIARLERPGRIKGVGEMRLISERITFPDGRSFPMSATLLSAYGAEKAKVTGSEGTVKGPGVRLKDTDEVLGGGVAGGVAGLLFHHPLAGVAFGGTVAVVDRLRRRGPDLTLPSGTQLNYQLTRSLEIVTEDRQAASAQRASNSRNAELPASR